MEMGSVESEDVNGERKHDLSLEGEENDCSNSDVEGPAIDEVEHSEQLSVMPPLMSAADVSDSSQDQQSTLVAEPMHNVKIVKVVPLPHARSEVWSYFGFIADDDGEIQDKKKAICKICASTLAYSGNTTNLFTHLKAMHPEANPQKLAPTNRTPRTGKKLGKRKLDSVDSPLIVRTIYAQNDLFEEDTTNPTVSGNSLVLTSVKSPPKSNSYTSDIQTLIGSEEITAAIVNMLVKDCRPICITEGKGFEELMRLLAPGYKIPDSRKLQALVKKRYDEVRRNLILRAMEDE